MALTEAFKGEFEELQKKTSEQVLNETRIIAGPTDGVYNRGKLKYKWAKDIYDKMRNNNWMETEISMQKDKEQWEGNDLTDREKDCFLRALAFASNLDGILTDSLSDVNKKYISSPEVGLAISRQIYEESLHVESYAYLIESIGLDPDDVYLLYQKDKKLFYKNKGVLESIYAIKRDGFDISTLDGKKEFLKACITNLIFEGIYFYSVFLIFYNFGRHNKMPGSKEMIQFINRDEDQHVSLFVNIINTIKEEFPEVWTQDVKDTIRENIVSAVKSEVEWGISCIKEGILGLTPNDLQQYLEFVGDIRLKSIGLDKVFNSVNPFSWLDEFTQGNMIEVNFFEGKVREYQTGTLEW
jgi:ribonucleoside-diphosphate reductase beta chain